jgi:hypothetical protein
VIGTDDIVLCRVSGNQYLHLVKAIQGERFQIGNKRGGINGDHAAPDLQPADRGRAVARRCEIASRPRPP